MIEVLYNGLNRNEWKLRECQLVYPISELKHMIRCPKKQFYCATPIAKMLDIPENLDDNKNIMDARVVIESGSTNHGRGYETSVFKYLNHLVNDDVEMQRKVKIRKIDFLMLPAFILIIDDITIRIHRQYTGILMDHFYVKITEKKDIDEFERIWQARKF